MAYTNGFRSASALGDHFKRHGEEVGVATASNYQAMADVFLGGPMAAGTRECLRGDGDTVRYNPTTGEFGIMSSTRTIRSYFKAKGGDPVKGLAYFNRVCNG